MLFIFSYKYLGLGDCETEFNQSVINQEKEIEEGRGGDDVACFGIW